VDIQSIKQRFGIIGNSPLLNRAIDVARQVAPTEMSVLITGESGVGKEVFSHIIHQISPRKHNSFIAINCGAIPSGTIDSELFGHEKGSFTGAHDSRKGYFEVVNEGTIFLDEVAELPLNTQSRLLRVLESGEYIRVGSSKVQKTNVRVIAATNVKVVEAVQNGKFREDLYYRLNTVPLTIPPLRERKEDIHLLFRKFVHDFGDKHRIPPLSLTEDAQNLIAEYPWPGNIRQLKNIAEQVAVLEKDRVVNAQSLAKYLPNPANSTSGLPMLNQSAEGGNNFSEREILYRVLFDMKKDMTELKKLVIDIVSQNSSRVELTEQNEQVISKFYKEIEAPSKDVTPVHYQQENPYPQNPYVPHEEHSEAEEVEETLSLADKEKEMIQRALKKHSGKRKNAAQELGISERTLYRKIKEYDL
jgi:transcriptional regulator with PAS, ATPase and Fis domain